MACITENNALLTKICVATSTQILSATFQQLHVKCSFILFALPFYLVN